MSERKPGITLNLGDGNRLEVTPENSTLYTFMGHTAIGAMDFDNEAFNHVFIKTSDQGSTASGMYFFQEHDQENYELIASHMMEGNFPMILNMPHVAECDVRVWMIRTEAAVNEFVDHIPDEL